jgi:hypothetical protein
VSSQLRTSLKEFGVLKGCAEKSVLHVSDFSIRDKNVGSRCFNMYTFICMCYMYREVDVHMPLKPLWPWWSRDTRCGVSISPG